MATTIISSISTPEVPKPPVQTEIVLDAGSSGTRVQACNWDEEHLSCADPGAKVHLGIQHVCLNSTTTAKYIRPLVEDIIESGGENIGSINLGATAGCREQLSPEEQVVCMANVESAFQEYFPEVSARVITGAEEARFAFEAMRANPSPDNPTSLALFEIGGQSAQVVGEVTGPSFVPVYY